MTSTKDNALLALANRLDSLRSGHPADWYVAKEPHDYADGTKHFNHVRYKTNLGSGHDITVEVGQYLTPDLAELLCLLHNSLDTITSALRLASTPAASGVGEVLKQHLRALEEFVSLSETDYCSDDTEIGDWREPDDEPVAAGTDSQSAVTFGSVRRAREAVDALSDALSQPPANPLTGDGSTSVAGLERGTP